MVLSKAKGVSGNHIGRTWSWITWISMVTANEWHADGGGGDWEDAQSKGVLHGEMGK